VSAANELAEIISMTRELVQRAANTKRGTIALSPEMAAYFTAEAPVADDSTNISAISSDGVQAPLAAPPAAPQFEPVDSSALSAISSLDELRGVVAGCRKCGLCETRTQTVFSDGNSTAQLVFVGEAPGADEDRQGVPFVGRAGQLLTDIIVKGMKMRREDVYICNVLKCRPPNNRDPLPSEKEQCEPYLVRQLELLKPKVICALGKHAANTLLRKDEATGRLRGKWHQYHGIPLRVTYHPAYLLRNPADKKLVWEDIQHVMRVLSGEEDPFAELGTAE